MVWNASGKRMECENCGTHETINFGRLIIHQKSEFNELSHSGMGDAGEVAEVQAYTCEGCGCTLEVHTDSGAGSCPYCGTDFVLSRSVCIRKPDGIIPFELDRREVPVIINNWMKRAFLAPGSFKQLGQQGAVTGSYIPFWSFHMDASGDYSGEGGEYHTETDSDGNEKRVIKWYHVRGHIRGSFYSYIPASKCFNTGLLKKFASGSGINDRSVCYDERIVSGYQLELYSVSFSDALKSAYSEVNTKLLGKAEADIRHRYDTARNVHLSNICHENEIVSQVAVPVYLTTVAYNGKPYQVYIDGQTGEIHGKYPLSPVKIAILVLALVALFVLYYFGKGAVTDKTDTASYYQEEQVVAGIDLDKEI